MKPFIDGRAHIPVWMLTPKEISYAKKKLLFTAYSMDEIAKFIKYDDNSANEVYEDDDGGSEEVNEFHCRHRMVSVPREWARKAWPHIEFVDKTAKGDFGIKFKHSIKPRDAEQKKFFNALLTEAQKPGPQDILANATTGAGKSVAAIWLGLELGVSTMILVDSNKLKNQYIKLIDKLMGEEWRKLYVGIVQQDTCDYNGKAIVIGMVQSLSSRQYDEDLFSYFGFVDYDEVQIFGTRYYSRLFSRFSARVRIGLTATNKKGSFGLLIKSHLGAPRVISKQEVMRPTIYIVQNIITEPFRCESDGELLTNLSRVQERNQRLATLIRVQGYGRGRQVLALSNRIRHLQNIQQLLIAQGVPEEAIGLHVGAYPTERFHLYYQYGRHGKKNRIATYPNYGQARTAYNRLLQGSITDWINLLGEKHPAVKRIREGEMPIPSTERETYAPTQNELDNITNSCQIVLATYEIFSKGVDVPRLDFGVECLPVGNVTQPLGRILRILKGKLVPEWVSFDDRIRLAQPDARKIMVANALNNWFISKAKARMKGFEKSGATIKVRPYANQSSQAPSQAKAA